jgi:hypothetical protein
MSQFVKKLTKISHESKRHFKVVMGGKEYGLYVSSTPYSAAKKAVTKLCASNKSKKVKFYIHETTQRSKKKTYGPYVGHIEKLKKPIELNGRVIKYKPVAKLSAKSGAKKRGMTGGAPKALGSINIEPSNGNHSNHIIRNPAEGLASTSTYNTHTYNNTHFRNNGNNAEFRNNNRNFLEMLEVNNRKFIDYFDFIFKGSYIELENISDEEIEKLLKNIPVKIEISRKTEKSQYNHILLAEVIVKITPITYSDELFFELKNYAIDKFKHFFKKRAGRLGRPSENLKIFVRTYVNESEYQNEDITQIIKNRASNELHKLKLIKISFNVFRDEKIINLIEQKIGSILRTQIFFGTYERKIDNISISYIGRTVLPSTKLQEKISIIFELLDEIPRKKKEIFKFLWRIRKKYFWHSGDPDDEFYQILDQLRDVYGKEYLTSPKHSPFIPEISEFRKNTENFVKLKMR